MQSSWKEYRFQVEGDESFLINKEKCSFRAGLLFCYFVDDCRIEKKRFNRRHRRDAIGVFEWSKPADKTSFSLISKFCWKVGGGNSRCSHDGILPSISTLCTKKTVEQAFIRLIRLHGSRHFYRRATAFTKCCNKNGQQDVSKEACLAKT